MNSFQTLSQYATSGSTTFVRAENFWQQLDVPTAPYELLRFSAYMGFFPFAGYLFSYSIVGRIWNYWPFIQSTLPVARAVMCAGLQWVFFATFPLFSALILERLFAKRWKPSDLSSWIVVNTYSMTPLFMAALFVGIPFFGRIFAVLGSATFLYILFFGYRIYLKHNLIRAAVASVIVAILFGLIRQMFVFVIGF